MPFKFPSSFHARSPSGSSPSTLICQSPFRFTSSPPNETLSSSPQSQPSSTAASSNWQKQPFALSATTTNNNRETTSTSPPSSQIQSDSVTSSASSSYASLPSFTSSVDTGTDSSSLHTADWEHDRKLSLGWPEYKGSDLGPREEKTPKNEHPPSMTQGTNKGYANHPFVISPEVENTIPLGSSLSSSYFPSSAVLPIPSNVCPPSGSINSNLVSTNLADNVSSPSLSQLHSPTCAASTVSSNGSPDLSSSLGWRSSVYSDVSSASSTHSASSSCSISMPVVPRPYLLGADGKGEDELDLMSDPGNIVIETTDDAYVVVACLPGFSLDCITLTSKSRRTLHILADRWGEGSAHFERKVSFGPDVSMSGIRAQFDGSYLRVTVQRRRHVSSGSLHERSFTSLFNRASSPTFEDDRQIPPAGFYRSAAPDLTLNKNAAAGSSLSSGLFQPTGRSASSPPGHFQYPVRAPLQSLRLDEGLEVEPTDVGGFLRANDKGGTLSESKMEQELKEKDRLIENEVSRLTFAGFCPDLVDQIKRARDRADRFQF
ncbi:HSP20-like chaperone [Phaffia rhodozyma]|uniref:HSP20-like chaperone n=1 Tax=Phaffia rhodozyma TaxID=264483 RepID=A0A0F7SX35_PHARH|nr:HSP20-like chaperone [Phaffia rhodozyma]